MQPTPEVDSFHFSATPNPTTATTATNVADPITNKNSNNTDKAFPLLGTSQDKNVNSAMDIYPEEKLCSLGYGASRICRVVIRAEELCLEVRMTPGCDFPCSTDFCATSLLEMQTECKVAVCDVAAALPPLAFQYAMFGMSLVLWSISTAAGFVYGGRWLARMPIFGPLSQSLARLPGLCGWWWWCLCCLFSRRLNRGRGVNGAAAAQAGAEEEADIERGDANGGGDFDFGGSRIRLVGDEEGDADGAGAFLSDHKGPIVKTEQEERKQEGRK